MIPHPIKLRIPDQCTISVKLYDKYDRVNMIIGSTSGDDLVNLTMRDVAKPNKNGIDLKTALP